MNRKKSFCLFALGILLFITSCIKEWETEGSTIAKNTTNHTIKVFPYYKDSVDLYYAFALDPNSEKKIFYIYSKGSGNSFGSPLNYGE